MSTNNNASLRYLILDRCFSNTHHQYTIDELLDIVNEKLGDKEGRSINIRHTIIMTKLIHGMIVKLPT